MRNNIGTVQFGTTSIDYVLRRSPKRKTIAVTVHPDRTVSVVAPPRIRQSRISRLVASKAEWILRQQEALRHQHDGFVKQFVSGESFFYLGRQYSLKVRQVKTARPDCSVQLTRGRFLVTIPRIKDLTARSVTVRESLRRWYRNKAGEHLAHLTAHFSQRMGMRCPTLNIREMKQRWGSMNAGGKINFNWRIIMAPKRLVEYVVAHELCHLRYDNHSQDFWQLLERTLPDYERRRSELAIVGAKFDLSITSEDIHRALFPHGRPKRRTIPEMKEGIKQHSRDRYTHG